MKNIAVFASGSGTNTEKFVSHFKNNEEMNIALIVYNQSDAFGLKRAENQEVTALILKREEFYEMEKIVEQILSLIISNGGEHGSGKNEYQNIS